MRNHVDDKKHWRLTGDREMQVFLLGYIIVSICEIFTIGGFPLNNSVRLVGYFLCTCGRCWLTVYRLSSPYISPRSLQPHGF